MYIDFIKLRLFSLHTRLYIQILFNVNITPMENLKFDYISLFFCSFYNYLSISGNIILRAEIENCPVFMVKKTFAFYDDLEFPKA